jgi:hypothetical protein
MHARQLRWSTLIALVVFAAACADSSLAPKLDKADRLPGGAPNMLIVINEMAADERSAEFTVDQDGGYFRMGKHGIVFPRSAICDPERSSYGPGTWDANCPVLRRPIRIRAELRSQDGREWVDFTPALRFRPSNDPSDWVWIYMLAGEAAFTDRSLNILWSPAIGVPGIDESLDDPTLRTYVAGGYAYRRIKHFSGYNVTSGRAPGMDDAREFVSEQP